MANVGYCLLSSLFVIGEKTFSIILLGSIFLLDSYILKICLTISVYICSVDILFLSNHSIHKSSYDIGLWASDPLIERF